MSEVTVVRTSQPIPSEQSLAGARQLLFGALEGFTAASKKTWRRIWGRIIGMEEGELIDMEIVIPRNPRFHRKFFALLEIGFDAWEPGRKHKSYKGREVSKNFESFREDITILSGYYDQTFDLQGRLKLRAKSISFASMDDPEFEQLYSAVIDVLLSNVLTAYRGREDIDAVVDRVLRFAA